METSGQDEKPEEKVVVPVEVCLKPTSTATHAQIKAYVTSFLSTCSLQCSQNTVYIPLEEHTEIQNDVEYIAICEIDGGSRASGALLFWQFVPVVHVFQLNEEGAAEEDAADDNVPSFQEWILPARDFHRVWDSLHYDTGIKQRLLNFAHSAMLFAWRGVDTSLITWNRVVMLHGPPGTGKTSLCKALAQKLSIRLGDHFTHGQLIEVNAHSLFSKWFSESGKLVSRLFSKIMEYVEDPQCLVFVLIDEVESLTSARKAAVSGSEPSDAIRAVNALLTQIDALRTHPNVMVLTTSNITEAIDVAFVDRADIKAYIGPPSLAARYQILRSCIAELQRAGIIENAAAVKLPDSAEDAATADASSPGAMLHTICAAADGFSGRTLRKLPFLAHASSHSLRTPCSHVEFLHALLAAVETELADRATIASG